MRQTNQLDGLHDLFLRRTYIGDPKIGKEIAKIVLPRRKKKDLPAGVKALLMSNEDDSEAEDEVNDDDIEDDDVELMTLDEALEDIDDDVELIDFDEI